MQLQAYHAEYLAPDLTKQTPPSADDRLSMPLMRRSIRSRTK